MKLGDISRELMEKSPFLRSLDLTEKEFIVNLSVSEHNLLLEYIKDLFPVSSLMWTERMIELVDFLMLDKAALINTYRITGIHKELIDVPVDFTLFDQPRKRWLYLAIKHGNLPVFQWAHADGLPLVSPSETTFTLDMDAEEMFGPSACETAAKYGHLHILEWASRNGCPLGPRVCYMAAEKGHLHIIKWARVNGCPWDHWTAIVAKENDQHEILKWVNENGGRIPKYLESDSDSSDSE